MGKEIAKFWLFILSGIYLLVAVKVASSIFVNQLNAASLKSSKALFQFQFEQSLAQLSPSLFTLKFFYTLIIRMFTKTRPKNTHFWHGKRFCANKFFWGWGQSFEKISYLGQFWKEKNLFFCMRPHYLPTNKFAIATWGQQRLPPWYLRGEGPIGTTFPLGLLNKTAN